jgi:hypothetical protein
MKIGRIRPVIWIKTRARFKEERTLRRPCPTVIGGQSVHHVIIKFLFALPIGMQDITRLPEEDALQNHLDGPTRSGIKIDCERKVFPGNLTLSQRIRSVSKIGQWRPGPAIVVGKTHFQFLRQV